MLMLALLIQSTPLPAGAMIDITPMSWITNDDYPRDALKAGVEGDVIFEVTIGVDGKVLDCDIWKSSGSRQLDGTTCQLMKVRARFDPGTDKYGQPISVKRTGYFFWKLPKRSLN